MNISKSDTEYAKGISLLFMYIHHLFLSQNQIALYTLYDPIYVFNNFRLEVVIGNLGHMCIPLLVFLSGYGFASIGKKKFSYYINKIFRFFQIYWFYFIICICVVPFFFFILSNFGIFRGYTFKFYFNIYEFLENFFAVSDSYNASWWYAEIYLGIILFAPLANLFRHSSKLLILYALSMFSMSYIASVFRIDAPFISIAKVMYWQVPFTMGYLVFLNKHLFDFLCNMRKKSKFLLLALLVAIVLFACNYVTIPYIIMFLGLPAIFACILAKELFPFLNGTLQLLGRYLFPLWIVHLFFSHYYCQPFIYCVKNPFLILLNLIGVSFVSVFFLEKLRKKIESSLTGFFIMIWDRFAITRAIPAKTRR